MLHLNQEWREGLVFKEDSQRNHRAKYVTGNVNIDDLRAASDNLLELPPEYFTNRLLHLILFTEKNDLTITPEMEQTLRKALLQGLHEAFKNSAANTKSTPPSAAVFGRRTTPRGCSTISNVPATASRSGRDTWYGTAPTGCLNSTASIPP